ncbi:hypothetical protein [Devosia sp.]|uniref:hypothetical protein n=1 Tax=Devosia sp. TaxID=1871048 RepID=UPI003262D9AF
MNLLAALAGLMGIQVDAMTEKLKRTVAVNAIVALFGLIALSFLLVAGYLALTTAVGPIFAALYIGAGALVTAVAVYLFAQIGAGTRQQKEAERRRSSETTALISTAAISVLPILLKSPLLRNIGLPLAAVAAFFILGGAGHSDDDDV